jgi:hypothetical protein
MSGRSVWFGCALLLISVHVWSYAAQSKSASVQMAEAAKRLLAALTPDQQKVALFDFDDAERKDWSNLPNSPRATEATSLHQAIVIPEKDCHLHA